VPSTPSEIDCPFFPDVVDLHLILSQSMPWTAASSSTCAQFSSWERSAKGVADSATSVEAEEAEAEEEAEEAEAASAEAEEAEAEEEAEEAEAASINESAASAG